MTTTSSTGRDNGEIAVLKAQLRSKMFQLDPSWRSREDILTGDFFGALDYLPRQPFLKDFLQRIVDLNSTALPLSFDRVDWNSIKLDFWPMTYGEDENAEPDLVIYSNMWVLVVEVNCTAD